MFNKNIVNQIKRDIEEDAKDDKTTDQKDVSNEEEVVLSDNVWDEVGIERFTTADVAVLEEGEFNHIPDPDEIETEKPVVDMRIVPIVGPYDQEGRPKVDPRMQCNIIERRTEGSVQYVDFYIYTFIGYFGHVLHVLPFVDKDAVVTIHLNAPVYENDARMILSAMDLCPAPITVRLSSSMGFYGACIVAMADHVETTPLSELIIMQPMSYIYVKGEGNTEKQIQQVKEASAIFKDILINSGLVTSAELDPVITKNQLFIIGGDDIKKRLNK